MAYHINQSKVKALVAEVNNVFQYSHQGFNHGECLIGLAEAIGRVIVDAASNKVQADDMMKVVMQHIDLTIRIGSEARNKRIITEL